MNEDNLKRIRTLHKSYVLTRKILQMAGFEGLFSFIWPYIENYVNRNYEQVEKIFKEIVEILKD